ncbi:hypothetical protein HAN_3g391 (nucleomorph) [Hemiselmis andersenii]|uniref:Rpb4 n=2 Tax=Hemiselmis andersenii TaxID=464988 RepID=A9BL18_HEMAN|nr:hypothetical protein HAN_3g391 [Hemiselmis andersenii]ABW98201.1 hypothetical protein HAN_3g391 [Hemiselmis andersenii]|mmetsp:Transcript_21636/g.50168  ORF Transcript_21636/g.50168 Transcript_21636/m.50168 type:complete len:139 (+) Transcript_21636:428-844(+)
MISEEWDFHSLENSNTQPLSLNEVLQYLNKRLNLIEILERKNFLFEKKNKNVNLEKIIEYTKRFSSFQKIKRIKNEITFKKFVNQNIIESGKLLKAQIFFCKILDLSPHTIEEVKNLLPGIEKIFDYKDIKNLIKLIN